MTFGLTLSDKSIYRLNFNFKKLFYSC
ncbi:hypothetical protein VCHENC02_0484A, partial [Vibrio harveyi]